MKIQQAGGEFRISLSGLEQALLDPANNDLMDLIMSRLLLSKDLSAKLPPHTGMGFEWWNETLRERLAGWYKQIDRCDKEMDRRERGDPDSDEESEASEGSTGAAGAEGVEGSEGDGAIIEASAEGDDTDIAVEAVSAAFVEVDEPEERWRWALKAGDACWCQVRLLSAASTTLRCVR
eukprot:SAG11_NODE_2030_length_3899_cov_6.833772_3_plen_178_part_00